LPFVLFVEPFSTGTTIQRQPGEEGPKNIIHQAMHLGCLQIFGSAPLKDILRIAENPIDAVILNAVPPVGFKRREEAAGAIAKYGIQVLEQAISVRAVLNTNLRA
jgi:hypothetical protein